MHVNETAAKSLDHNSDIDGNQTINTNDLEEFKLNYLGLKETLNWKFYEKEVGLNIASSNPRASYLAIKKGDIDDSALLGEESIGTINNTFSFDDQLLNAGETYNVGFKFEEALSIYGMDIRRIVLFVVFFETCYFQIVVV